MNLKISIGLFAGLINSTVFACSFSNIKLPINKQSQLQRDCRIQDTFADLEKELKSMNVDIEKIAEYRTLRFISRDRWEDAKKNSTHPSRIYNPAPLTWDIWSSGIDRSLQLFSNNKSHQFDKKLMSDVNILLLTKDGQSSKDSKTDEQKLPGEYRKIGDADVAFCSHEYPSFSDYLEKENQSLASTKKLQNDWEKYYNIGFQDFIQKRNGINPFLASLSVSLRNIAPGCGTDGKGTHITYVKHDAVEAQLSWLFIFLNHQIEESKKGRMFMSPIALSAFVQKWFVTIHPFADGNGRTSRALEEMILKHFQLPYPSTGELQNDVLESLDVYIENHYNSYDRMLATLKKCVGQYKKVDPNAIGTESFNSFVSPECAILD